MISETEVRAIADAAAWHDALELGFIAIGCAGFAGVLMTIIFARLALQIRHDWARRKRAEAAPAFLDVPFLDGLAASAPPERIAALFRAMSLDCKGRIRDIRDAARAGDLYRVQAESEALAESCEAFGATGLADQARRLLVSVRDRAFDEAARTLIEIDAVAHRTFDALADRAEV